MFLGKAQAPPEPAEVVEPVPPPRQKVAAKDSKIFRPSNFASRAAEAAANNAIRSKRRLVSLGMTEFHQRGKNGDTTVIDVELFYDYDHPADRFVEWPNQLGLMPLQSDERSDPPPVKHPPMKNPRQIRLAGAFEPAPPAPPPRPV